MSVSSAPSSSWSFFGAWASRLRCLCTVQRWTGTCGHSAVSAASSPAAPSTMASSGVRKPRAAKTVQKCTPGRLALSAHVLEAEQHLLPIAAHTERDQHRQPGGALVETNPHDRAVEDETNDVVLRQISLLPRLPVRLHLVPGPAHHVLANGPTKQRAERPSHPPGVAAGEIDSGDQRLGPLG